MSELLIVGSEQDNTRLDRFLADQYEEYTRSFLQKLIDQGNVSINGISVKKSGIKLKENDEIAVTLPEPQPLEVVAEDIPLDILYEDDDVILINKPKGMVVHPAAGNETGTLVNAIMYHCGDRLSSINGIIRPGIVHRIDKDTSGLLVIAKNDAAHESLSKQLAEHSVTRRYEALIFDNLNEDEGTVNEPLSRDPANRLRYAVVHDKNSKRAVTHWKVIKRFGRFTLIEARLETGRTHQIRVHMSYIKHPLVGDMLYGPRKQPFDVSGQLLHAKKLGFIHPKTGEYMEFETQRPEIFDKVLEKLENHT